MDENNKGEGSSRSKDDRLAADNAETSLIESKRPDVHQLSDSPSDPTPVGPEPAPTIRDDVPTDASEEARKRVEASSDDRKRSLREAREAALTLSPNTSGTAEAFPSQSTPSSDFAYPSQTSYAQRAFPAPSLPPQLPPSYSPYSSRSGLITGLKRLSYILSLVLGSSAIIGLFWSTFILPLLHSTFSARQVILEQQSPRFLSLVTGLRSLRSNPLFPPKPVQKAEEGTEGYVSDEEKKMAEMDHKSGIEEIPTSDESEASHASRQGGSRTKAISLGGDVELKDVHPLPLRDLSALSDSLRSLTTAIGSTSTTRVSLLSTLETYTSQLHREVYLRSDPKSSFSVGLGSLSQNLASASGGNVKTGNTDGRTEWDDVRKEVRAIKGLLLGRRNFVPIQS